MNAHTHILGGLAAAGLALSAGLPHPVILAVASGLGGLAPDWDHPGSTFGRWVPWPAVSRSRGPHLPPAVGRRGWPHNIWHRHQAHSVAGVALASVVLTALTAAIWAFVRSHSAGLLDSMTFPTLWAALGLFLGGLSHLALDGFNETPQWWLWPFSRREFRWPWHAPARHIDGPASLALTVLTMLLAWHLRWLPPLRLAHL